VDLLTIGEAFEDVIFAGLSRLPRLGEELRVRTLTRHPGGGAVLTAIAAARLGTSVGAISAVSPSNDLSLRAEGIELVNLLGPGERGAVTVALSTASDRAFVTFQGVNEQLERRLLDAIRPLRRLPRHVHFALGPKTCGAWIPIVERLRHRGATTSWDFGWNEQLRRDPAFDALLGAVDWIFVNEDEAKLYAHARTLATALTRWRMLARGTVVKLGPRGAVAITNGATVRRATAKAVVVDTTGAGDAFNGGFLTARLAGASLDDAIRLANHVGTRSTRASGGVDGLPHRGELPLWGRRIVGAA
jgi:sugar/nucleoside kinase (ribokinase family)